MTKKPNKSPIKNGHFCKFCNTFIRGTIFHFKCHLYVHDAVPSRYRCKYCTKEFFRNDLYKRHVENHMNIPRKHHTRYICDYCDRGFFIRRTLIDHIRFHESNMTHGVIKPRFSCNACGKDFCERRILMNHIRRFHFNLVSSDEPAHMKRTVNDSWFETVVQTNVRVQMTKVKNNIIVIKKCGKIETKDTGKSKVAKNSFYDNGYTYYTKAICDYCNKEMLKKSIEKHISERHLKIRKFKCPTCTQTFKRNYQMSRHKCGVKRIRRTREQIEIEAAEKYKALKEETT